MSRFKPYIGIACLLCLICFVGLAASPSQGERSVIRGQHLELVNAAGNVVFRARATDTGGHLEIRDGAGDIIFSTGIDPAAPDGLWEQARREIVHQRRDLNRQYQALQGLTREFNTLVRQRSQLDLSDRLATRVERHRSDLERYRRDLVALERQMTRLSQRLDSAERRR